MRRAILAIVEKVAAKPAKANKVGSAHRGLRRRLSARATAVALAFAAFLPIGAKAQNAAETVRHGSAAHERANAMTPENRELFEKAGAVHRAGRYGEALPILKKLAEQGIAPAQYSLGVIYSNAQGVPRDYPQALRWYRLAADQGYALAQVRLGMMYKDGEGVQRDFGTALAWTRKAADQGEMGAVGLMSWFYIEGKGTRQDYAAGMAWLRKAVEAGDDTKFGRSVEEVAGLKAAAEDAIGRMYEQGAGVPRDMNIALEWYRKAAAHGNEDAKAKLAQAQEPSTSGPGTISLVCDDRTGGGRPIKSFIFIDPAKKYARYQEPSNTVEYRDGVYGKALTSGTFLLLGPAPAVHQFVTIGDDIITFGGKGPTDTTAFRVDRRTGLVSVSGAAPIRCIPLPNRRQF